MALADAGKETMLNHLGGQVTYASLHNAAGTELAGGAYARQVITWNAATSAAGTSTLNLAGAPVFDVPAGAEVAQFGLQTAAVAGTQLGLAALSATETFVAAGQYTLSDANITLT